MSDELRKAKLIEALEIARELASLLEDDTAIDPLPKGCPATTTGIHEYELTADSWGVVTAKCKACKQFEMQANHIENRLFNCDYFEQELVELRRMNAKNNDVKFLLAKAYVLFARVAEIRDELGAEADIWLMQYKDWMREEEE